MRRVLVVGGAGFIGSHLCDGLLAHDYDVRVLDYLVPQVHPTMSWPDYLDQRVGRYHGCVTDLGDVLEATQDVDAVIHLAARVGVGQSAYEMESYVKVNTYGTANLLQVLKDRTIKKLIVASSMSVYGEGAVDLVSYGGGIHPDDFSRQPIPTPETHPPDLQSIYALTKYDQERMCLLWGRAYGVPTIALRFFNVYGTRQSLSNPYTGVIAIFASRLLNNRPPVIFEDGLQRRDFVHVSDVVRGIRLALESDVQDEVINIGSGTSYTILQVAEKLTTLLGKDLLPVITNQHRQGDIRYCFADISKAQRLLGYKPATTFDDGLAQLVPWLREQVAVDRLDEHHRELVEKGLLK